MRTGYYSFGRKSYQLSSLASSVFQLLDIPKTIEPTGLYKSPECKFSREIPTMGTALLRKEVQQTERLTGERT
jgi:hypothetical protein